MTPNERKRALRLDLVLAGIMVAVGLTMAGVSLAQLQSRDSRMAQTTSPPAATTPSVPAGNDNGPAESKPGGTRPTTPPPEPARPDAEAQKKGASPALPAAPAEKMGEPVQK
ncbi:hypothetical protein ASC80_15385 [Afipia sp. Root123D2]|uniref:hypothetical protein n=1 Tax=Afipia sp. Root123D2 TaxID=1736436 RepID=UPI0006F7D8B0|nr:hypothetical protein [Afipia sp. Root123D2]KQW19563.1 hypothetical protein ASC80_15385 [Afipia sp. Root123D2]